MIALGVGPVRACPFCASETGRRVRAEVFNADFGTNLLATLLPFAVLLGLTALIHFGPPRVRGWSRPSAPQTAQGHERQP